MKEAVILIQPNLILTVMYAIFSVLPNMRAKSEDVLKDDIVSRQSIVMRESSALGLKDLGLLIMVEGEERAVKRAEELFKDIGKLLVGAQAADIYQRFKKESEDVASGVGMVFG